MSSKDYAVMPYSDYFGACEAIREKDGSSAPIKSGELRSKILGIETGADVSVVTATAPDVLNGKIIVDKDGNPLPGSMPNNGAFASSISSVSQKITIPKGFHNGNGSVAISATEQAKIIPENIASGITILGKTGTYSGGTYVSGSYNVAYTQTNNHPDVISITGLGFKPKFIIAFASKPKTDPGMFDTYFAYCYYVETQGICSAYAWSYNDKNVPIVSSEFSLSVTDDGFNIHATGNHLYHSIPKGNILWFAC